MLQYKWRIYSKRFLPSMLLVKKEKMMIKLLLILTLFSANALAFEHEFMISHENETIDYESFYSNQVEGIRTLHLDYNLELGNMFIISLGTSNGFGEVSEKSRHSIVTTQQVYKSYRVGFGVRF